ncbi:MAG: hypothetical protein Q8R60_10875 [Mycobacteriales bacterium]|nr:hypothetical protein [Mycobacteriales bacterium]
MSATTTPTVDAGVKKTGSTLVGKLTVKNLPTLPTLPALPTIDLTDVRKPGFAAVGVLDLVIEQVKDVPADAKKVQDKAQADALARFATATELVKTLPATVPAQAKTLRTELEGRVSTATEKATAVYAQLAVRGERLVTSIRRQPATEAALTEGKEAVKKAGAAATAAKKAVKAGEQAVEDAADKIG